MEFATTRHWVYAASIIAHLALVFYGLWHDSYFPVPFTDVDYRVYTDASLHMLNGRSPFERHTFRYTPVLSWMLIPCITVHMIFGKLLFCAANIGVGYVIERILLLRSCKKSWALGLASLWLFSPIPLTVSARGNADSIICLMVMLVVYYLLKGRLVLTGVFLGLAVHLKVYPGLFALPVCVYLASLERESWKKQRDSTVNVIRRLLNWVGVCPASIVVGVVSLAVFGGLTLICYYFYGYEFLYETYLYHISRKDNRHNFSPLFLIIYLTFDQVSSSVLALAAFVPQILCAIAVGVYFAPRRFEVACFLQVLLFVAFNKVCTAQYFLWWQSLLPLVIFSVGPLKFIDTSISVTEYMKDMATGNQSKLKEAASSSCPNCAYDQVTPFVGNKLGLRRSPFKWLAGILLFWQATQGFWLLFGYQVEMLGLPSYVNMFWASILFLSSNLALAAYVICMTCTCTIHPASTMNKKKE